MTVDRRRLKAWVLLAWSFIVHLWRRYALGERRGLAQFRAAYAGDGIYPLTARDRPQLPALSMCLACSRCDPFCPVPDVAEGAAFSGPRAIAAASSRLLPATATWADAFLCTGCHACEQACPAGVPVVEAARRMRREVVAAGSTPLRAELARLLEPPPPVAAPRAWPPRERMDHVLFMGCSVATRPPSRLPDLLRALGVRFALVAGGCCGALGAAAGGRGAEEWIEDLLGRLRAPGAISLVVADPRCWLHLRANERVRSEFEVVHAFELLKGHAVRVKHDLRVTYQDPCYLVRQAGWTGLPREVIRRTGADLVEMPESGFHVRCCGAGDGVLEAAPALAHAMARRRLRQAEETGAELILTSGADCFQNLLEAEAEVEGGAPIKVASIVDFLHASL